MSKLRFSSVKHPNLQKLKKFRFSFLFFLLLFIFFLYWIFQIDHMAEDKKLESLELALQHDIVHCYAVEGIYPPSLDYLVDHYGLIYDHDDFYIDYRPIGSNIYPDYEIITIRK